MGCSHSRESAIAAAKVVPVHAQKENKHDDQPQPAVPKESIASQFGKDSDERVDEERDTFAATALPPATKVTKDTSIRPKGGRHERHGSLGTWTLEKTRTLDRPKTLNSRKHSSGVSSRPSFSQLGSITKFTRAENSESGDDFSRMSSQEVLEVHSFVSQIPERKSGMSRHSRQVSVSLMHPSRFSSASFNFAPSINAIAEFQQQQKEAQSATTNDGLTADQNSVDEEPSVKTEMSSARQDTAAESADTQNDNVAGGETLEDYSPSEPCGNCHCELEVTSALLCLDCQMTFCASCDTRFHRPKRFAEHQRFFVDSGEPLLEGRRGTWTPHQDLGISQACDNCDSNNHVMAFSCRECSKNLCVHCDHRMHLLTKNSQHHRLLFYRRSSEFVHTISLLLSCKNIPKLDVCSESDPYVVVEQRKFHEAVDSYTEVGRTETIANNGSPVFSKEIELGLLEIDISILQQLRFRVFDSDVVSNDDFSGALEIVLADVLATEAMKVTRPLLDDDAARPIGHASITVQAILKQEVKPEQENKKANGVVGSGTDNQVEGDLSMIESAPISGDVYSIDASGNELKCHEIIFPIGERQIWQVSAGHDFFGAVSVGGILFMMGANGHGQLGTGDVDDRFSPTAIGVPSAVFIACGYEHSVSISSDGTVRSWGNGGLGRLGSGDDLDRKFPQQISLHDFHDRPGMLAAAGHYNSAIITADEKLYTWGAGQDGTLGNGTRLVSMRPCLVETLEHKDVISVSFGERHAAAVTEEGALYTWGNAEFHRLGYEGPEHGEDNTKEDEFDSEHEIQLRPRRVVAVQEECIEVSCGHMHTSVLTASGALLSFGSGETHQIGIMDNEDQEMPTRAEIPLNESVVSLATGATVSGASTKIGASYIWGFGVDSAVPTLLKPMEGQFVGSLALGGMSSLFAHTQPHHEVFCIKMQESDDTPGEPQLIAERNPNLQGPILVDIVAGEHVFLSRTCHNHLLVWGDSNEHGQLGIGSDDPDLDIQIPRRLQKPANVIQVCCGVHHCLVLSSEGQVHSWGAGLNGALGHGSQHDRNAPALVVALAEMKVISIGAGRHNSGAIVAASGSGDANNAGTQVYVWGAGESGQIGDGGQAPRLKPHRIDVIDSCSISSIGFGDRHTVALATDGSVWAWGDNQFGQLGIESHHVLEPSKLPTFDSQYPAASIWCGANHTLVCTERGEVLAFGSGETQQTGLGHCDDVFIPTKVEFIGADSQVDSISIGLTATLVVTQTGQVFAFGWNISQVPLLLSQSKLGDKACTVCCAGATDLVLLCS